MFWSSLVHLRDVGKIDANVLGLIRKKTKKKSMAKPLGGAFYLTQCFVPNYIFSPILVQQPQKGKKEF